MTPSTLVPADGLARPAANAALPEVTEREATGLVAELYADIRATLGVPLVNLIYRYLATDVQVLQWTWTAVRPHLVSGEIGAQASALRRALALHVAGWDLRHAGALPDPRAAADLVQTYNIGNSLNLMSLTHLLHGQAAAVPMASGRDISSKAPQQSTASAPQAAMPPLPALAQLPPDEADRVLRLNRFAEAGEPEIVASLYRHLAAWPGVLSGVEAALAPLESRGVLSQARIAAVAQAVEWVQRRPLPMPPRPAAFDAHFAARVAGFVHLTIPKMVPIGLALEQSFRRRETGI